MTPPTSILEKSALAGKIKPIVSSLFLLSKEDFTAIVQNVGEIANGIDLAVLCALGWGLVPCLGIVYSFLYGGVVGNAVKSKGKKGISLKRDGEGEECTEDCDGGGDDDDDDESYHKSYLFLLSDHIAQMARLALLVYACDCIVVVFHTIGYNHKQWSAVSKVFAKILYTSWVARRLQTFKSYVVRKALNKAPKNCDKLKMVNRILDGVMLAVLLVKILDFLSVETGFALTSIAAVGTTGGLIVSLASQEIAKGILSGVEMASSDRFYEGDEVHFGDGTQGYIQKLGFLRTKVRKYDESEVNIPNSQLGGQRVCNISRTNRCRVVTKLRFHYDDIQKLPEALASIKEEIVQSCPKIITKGKPFRAKISSFERDHVQATVDCRFELPPVGDAFWDNREEMFLAIDRAVRKAGLNFATPIFPSEVNF
ncbi:hypothetical protein ACHAXS_007834 [Conticribra weissflogii]